jgi:hypothetical protein
MVVTDDPVEFAAAVVRLLIDGNEWRARRRDIEELREHWAANRGRSWVEVIDDAIAGRGEHEETG